MIARGAIAADFSGEMVRDSPEVNKMVASMTALGRSGQPDDTGRAVAMLRPRADGLTVSGSKGPADGALTT